MPLQQRKRVSAVRRRLVQARPPHACWAYDRGVAALREEQSGATWATSEKPAQRSDFRLDSALAASRWQRTHACEGP
jgi:hypothetical protein